MFIEDCHTHTKISPDGEGTIEELAKRADEIGLKVLTVTEHVELCRFFSKGYYGTEPRNEWEFYNDCNVFDKALENETAAKKKGFKVKILAGIELGEINAEPSLADVIYKDKRLDFVIGSLHELLNKEDFFELDYSKEDPAALLDEYFKELLTIAKSCSYDVLGHITYPLRYMEGEYGYKADMDKYMPHIENILKEVIRQNKGIELNTSGLRQKYKKTFPDKNILKLYKSLGGKIITIGSDAHNFGDLAKGTDIGIKMLKNIGFEKIAYFEKHMPVFIDI